MSEAKQRKQHTEEFKTDAVCLMRQAGKPVSQVARGLGIDPNLLHRWRGEEHRAKSLGTTRTGLKADAEELVRLPAHALNLTKRLIESPKVFWGDTCVALHLGSSAPAGVHLRTFRGGYGRKARAGLLLHTGRTVEWLTPDVLAVPWWRVL
jgi:transposase